MVVHPMVSYLVDTLDYETIFFAKPPSIPKQKFNVTVDILQLSYAVVPHLLEQINIFIA